MGEGVRVPIRIWGRAEAVQRGLRLCAGIPGLMITCRDRGEKRGLREGMDGERMKSSQSITFPYPDPQIYFPDCLEFRRQPFII